MQIAMYTCKPLCYQGFIYHLEKLTFLTSVTWWTVGQKRRPCFKYTTVSLCL